MKKQKKQKQISGEELVESAEAAESGYHPPTPEDIRDINHDHNTAEPGSITADEAIRRDVA
ncbi:MAG: hypothetical protein AB7K68_06045 [Bacteriovoracia bacterium]